MHEPRVLIAGAGPVGLTSALFLVGKGVPVLVVESGPELSEDMRASTFHPPTLDMLKASGIADRLIPQGHIAQQWQYRQHENGKSVVFDLSTLEGLTAHPYRLQCEQFRMTRAIVEMLADNPLFEIRFNAAVESVGQDDGGAWADVAQADGTVRIDAEYIIAADGGRSTIRRLLDLSFDGETYPRTSITVVVDHAFQNDIPDILPVNYLWTADDHFSLMRVGANWRVGFSPRAGQELDEATSPKGIEERLQAILPRRDSYRIVHVGAYSVHRRVIDNFRHGRILFAGDAAHLNSPAGGMGMNSGVHDAHALAEHLGPVLEGADPALLDRYARRRRAIAVEDVQAQSDRNYKRHREKDPELRKQIWADFEHTVADRNLMRDFLFRSSMLASLERSLMID